MAEAIQDTFLYEFKLGTNTWRFTSNSLDVLDNTSARWTSCAISDDGVKQTGEAVTDELRVTAPTKIAPSQLFLLSPPKSDMALNIYRASVVPITDDQLQAGAIRNVINLRAIYAGEVVQASFPMRGTTVFTVETISATMKRDGLRLGWQRGCPHCVYDPVTCKVVKATHARAVTISSISGLVVTVTGTLETSLTGLTDIYNGGVLEFSHPIKGTEALAIESQAGQSLTMFGTVEGLYVGQSVTVYRGCRNDPASCIDFGNYPNYGGCPNLPGKSPFEGTSAPVF